MNAFLNLFRRNWGLKLLALICTSNLNVVDDVCRIENVSGLTGSKHYVVGNINKCVDGA